MLSKIVKHKAFKRRSKRKGQDAGVYNSTIREVDEDNPRDLFFECSFGVLMSCMIGEMVSGWSIGWQMLSYMIGEVPLCSISWLMLSCND